jgi:uncharacterized protein
MNQYLSLYIQPVALLIIANIFMTFAWYGHLKFEAWGWLRSPSIWLVILLSWGMAFFEYIFQVPANKLGYTGNGGVYSLMQLKVIQEVITLTVFAVFVQIFFKGEPLRFNHAVSAICLVFAVYFAFKE